MSYCKRCGEIGHYDAQCPKLSARAASDPLSVFDPGPRVRRKAGNAVTPGNAVTVPHCPTCHCFPTPAARKQRAYRARKRKGDTN